MNSDIGRVDGSSYEESGSRFDPENSGIQHRGPGKITDVESVSAIGGGDGSRDAVDLSCVGGERPNESAAGGVAGTRSVRKKIVKKTVIVKRVIMKRVPKRVLINGSRIRGEMTKVEEGTNLSEVGISGADLASDVIQNSNVVEKTCRVNEAKDTLSAANDLAESLNPVNYVDTVEEKPSIVYDVLKEQDIRAEVPQNLEIVSASGPVICEEVDDLSAQMESEMSKPVTDANVSGQMVSRNYQNGLHDTDADDIKGNDPACEVERNDLGMCSRDLEVDKAKFSIGTISERENSMIENQLKDCSMENQRIDIVNTADMELLTGQNVGPIGEEREVLSGKENGRATVEAESCSREVEAESCSREVESDGEIEALERKKKRKTEIFLGGLSKSTKEENIREVFEDVGSVVEVRIVVNPTSGKNRGFAFVRFATAADAQNALAKYSEVEVTRTMVPVTYFIYR